jgi:hypothetical protein
MSKKRKINQLKPWRVLCHCGSAGTVPDAKAKDEWIAKHNGHSHVVWQPKPRILPE